MSKIDIMELGTKLSRADCVNYSCVMAGNETSSSGRLRRNAVSHGVRCVLYK